MNKKILMLLVSVLAVAMLATPAFASPTKGNKVAATLIFVESTGRTIIEDRYSNGILHRLLEITYNVELKVTDEPTLEGTASWERMSVQNPQSTKNVMREYYEFWFPIEGGGFEGHCLIIMDGFDPPPPPPATWETSKAYGLFQGTEAFEGQTFNFGHSWEEPTGTIVWTGYWLKP